MVLPGTLAELFYKKLGFYSCTVSNFEQYTLAEFINGGHFGNHINRLRRHYREVRDLLLGEIAGNAAFKDAVIAEKDSGLHFLIRLDADKTDEELVREAHRHEINISCLSDYYDNQENAPSSTLVINYSGIEKEKIPEAVRRLGMICG